MNGMNALGMKEQHGQGLDRLPTLFLVDMAEGFLFFIPSGIKRLEPNAQCPTSVYSEVAILARQAELKETD